MGFKRFGLLIQKKQQ